MAPPVRPPKSRAAQSSPETRTERDTSSSATHRRRSSMPKPLRNTWRHSSAVSPRQTSKTTHWTSRSPDQ